MSSKDREEAVAKFETSLKRTGAGYFDMYLLHNLGDPRTANYEKYDMCFIEFNRYKKGLLKTSKIMGNLSTYIINPALWPFLLRVNPVLIETLSYIFVSLVVADITLSVCVLKGLENRVNDINGMINERLGSVVENINPKGRNLKHVVIKTVDSIEERDIDRLVGSMGKLHQYAIYKIKGFSKSSSNRINSIKSKIKERINIIRNRNER